MKTEGSPINVRLPFSCVIASSPQLRHSVRSSRLLGRLSREQGPKRQPQKACLFGGILLEGYQLGFAGSNPGLLLANPHQSPFKEAVAKGVREHQRRRSQSVVAEASALEAPKVPGDWRCVAITGSPAACTKAEASATISVLRRVSTSSSPLATGSKKGKSR
jgi:hypothetical protein